MNNEIIEIRSIPSDVEVFELMWQLTNWCNYKCPYCFQPFHTKVMEPEEKLVEIAGKINQFLINQNKQIVTMSLLGGEITYYDLTKILDNISIQVIKLVIVTNFSQSIDYFKNLYNYCAKRKTWLHLMCSYHEVGDQFFQKYMELTKWCVANDYPMPIISFVFDNDFDFNVFEKFPDLPHQLIHFNLKQLKEGGLVVLNKDVESKWKEFNDTKYKWPNNKIIIPYLKKRKEQPLWWQYNEYGYEVIYDNGEKEHLGNIKYILMKDPSLLHNPNKYCNSLLSGCFITPNGDIVRCSTVSYIPSEVVGNVYVTESLKIEDANIFKCKYPYCPLCHNVNIYNNLKTFLENEKLEV